MQRQSGSLFLQINNMANLLPQNKKKEISQEHNVRFLTALFSVSGAVLIIATVLLASLYVLLDSRLAGLDQTYKIIAAKDEDTSKLEDSIKDILAKLELLEKNSSQTKIPYGIFKSVIDIKPNGVSLTKMSYSAKENQISVSGVAAYRKDLQDFIEAIENHESFLPVEYPFSNITQKEDIDFSLIINMKTGDEK